MTTTFSLDTTQDVTATLAFFADAAGTIPAVASAGVPTWSVPDGSVFTLAVAADGLSAVLTSVAAGTVTVTVTLANLVATAEVTVTGPVATVMNLVFGVPALKA